MASVSESGSPEHSGGGSRKARDPGQSLGGVDDVLDPVQFAREIHKAGYATSPTYSNQLIKIMRDYDLLSLGRA